MCEEAQRGLDWRNEYGRGGTEVGVARIEKGDMTNPDEAYVKGIARAFQRPSENVLKLLKRIKKDETAEAQNIVYV